MAVTSASSLNTILSTSLSLIENFLSSLDVASAPAAANAQQADHPSPLELLTAAATALRSTATKISLLTITAPFTPSAIVSSLQPLNTSVLPSLLTATLLTTSKHYPDAFVCETHSLTRSSLKDLKNLLLLIKSRSEASAPSKSVTESDKKAITEATGKVWEDCDFMLQLARDDIPGFVVRKAKQWLDLMKDAVQELQDWDPEEEDIEDQDWLGLDDGDDNDGAGSAHSDGDGQGQVNGGKPTNTNGSSTPIDTDRATISAGVKEQALKVLSRIPQSIHVVIKQRLEKLPVDKSSSNPLQHSQGQPQPMAPIPTKQKKTLNLILKRSRAISECIDESAESMYMGNLEQCLRKAGEARALTIEVVEAVVDPWVSISASRDETSDGVDQKAETKEDQYIKRALAWVRQVETDPIALRGKNRPVT